MLKSCFHDNGEINEDEFAILVKKFKGKIIGYSRNFFLPGGDYDDLYQWGVIGLYHAVLKYEEVKGNSFYLIADCYIKNTIKTAVTTANRKKHEVLNGASSLHYPIDDGVDADDIFMDYICNNKAQDPLALIIQRENVECLTYAYRYILSKLEKVVMGLYVAGYKQSQIAIELGMDKRVVDNAIQRSRRKLMNHLITLKEVV